MSLIEPGLWLETGPGDFKGRPALFLDRDGVVVVDTNYLGRVEDLQMIAGSAEAIARCNALQIPVALVTNQSGIARGYYDWQSFQAVQQAICAELAVNGAHFDAVLACAYHMDGCGSLQADNHPWRKPNSGMIVAAAQAMEVDMNRSWIVGDKIHDLAAGRAAGLAGGTLLTASDVEGKQAATLASAQFAVEVAPDLAVAVTRLLERGQLGMKP